MTKSAIHGKDPLGTFPGLTMNQTQFPGREVFDSSRPAENSRSLSMREVRRSSTMFTRAFAASIPLDARQGSVLGFAAAGLPILQVRMLS